MCLDLVNAVALAVIFGNFCKSLWWSRGESPCVFFGISFSSEARLSAAIFDVLLSLCVPPNLYTGSISMLMIQIVQKVHFDLLIWPESCPIFCGP